jgi:hypothetical protein
MMMGDGDRGRTSDEEVEVMDELSNSVEGESDVEEDEEERGDEVENPSVSGSVVPSSLLSPSVDPDPVAVSSSSLFSSSDPHISS